MATRQLQEILLSGEITGQNMGGVDPGNAVPTIDSLVAAGYVKWRGFWVPGTYQKSDMVRDELWLSIANKETVDRPKPVEVGAPEESYPLDPTFSIVSNPGVVTTGSKYTMLQDTFLEEVWIWVPATDPTISYTFVIQAVIDPANPITIFHDPFIVQAGAWNKILKSRIILEAGIGLNVFIIALESASNTLVQGVWLYDGSSNPTLDPGVGRWGRNSNYTALRVNKLDDLGADRSAALMGTIPGSTVRFTVDGAIGNFDEFGIVGPPVDLGLYVEWETDSLTSQGTIAIDDITDMDAIVPVAAETEYVEEIGYWLTHTKPAFTEVEGFLSFGGVPQIAGDNAYGVKIVGAEAQFSPDWDIVAISAYVS